MNDTPDILTLYPVSKIETLERAARIDGLIAKQLSQSMSINATLQARIEALEAALREIVQWTEDYRFYAPAVGKIARAALDKDAGQ
jgi:hypothetical protein